MKSLYKYTVTLLTLLFLFQFSSYGDIKLGFSKMEAYRFKKGIKELNIIDINGDGLKDIIFANNKESRIEILLRNKVIDKKEENELKKRFKNVGFIVDQYIEYVRLLDFDKDGLPDLITTGTPLGINVRFQNKDHSFGEPKNIYLGSAIDFSYFDVIKGDVPKLMLSRKHNIEFISCSKDRVFKSTNKIKFPNNNCSFGLLNLYREASPFKDLLLYFTNTRPHLRIRFGNKEEKFGWEYPLPLPYTIAIDFLLWKNQRLIGTVLKNRKVFRLYKLEQSKPKNILDLKQVDIAHLPLMGVKSSTKKAWLINDFNNDGNDDLCIAAPKLSQLLIYYGTEKGLSPFPTHINTITDVDAILLNEKKDIIVYSSKEKVLARHSVKALQTFPTLLTLKEEPIAMGYQNGEIYTLGKNSEKIKKKTSTKKSNTKSKKRIKYHLYKTSWKADGSIVKTEKWDTTLKTIPTHITIFNLSATEKGLIFFIPYKKPEIFKLDKKGLHKLKTAKLLGLSTKTKLSQIAILPTNKKEDHLLICSKGVAYEYQFQNDAFAILKQFNTATGNETLSTPLIVSDNKTKQTLFLDKRLNNILLFSTPKKYKKLHIKSSLSSVLGVAELKQKNGKGFIFISSTEFYYLAQQVQSPKLKKVSEYATKTEKASFWNFKFINAGKTKSPVKLVALFDKGNRGFEFISYDGKNIKFVTSIEVFKSLDQFSRKSTAYEPNDLEVGDINNDGMLDFVILVHDRLLIYLGE
jgi:hypothetical protein